MVLFFLSKVQKVLLFLLSLNFVNFSCCWFISEESTVVLLSFDTEGFNLVTLHQLNLPFEVISFEKRKSFRNELPLSNCYQVQAWESL